MTEQTTPPMYHALIAAVKQDSPKALRELAARGADVKNLRTKSGKSLLHIAVKNKSHNAAVWLMRHDIDIDAVDDEGCSALDRALREMFGTAAIVMSLLGRGARVDTIADTSKMHRRFAPLLDVVQVDCPAQRAIVIQNSGLARYQERRAVASDVLARTRYNLSKRRMIEICVALQNMRLPALVTLLILEHLFLYADMIPIHRKSALVTTVKHWRERREHEAEKAVLRGREEMEDEK